MSPMPAGGGAKAKARQEAQRARILEAARKCFSEGGFHGAGMSAIAREAGMSQGLIYRYFASKAAIIQAITEEQRARRAQDLCAIATFDDLVDRLMDKLRRWKAGTAEDDTFDPALFLKGERCIVDGLERGKTGPGQVLRAAPERPLPPEEPVDPGGDLEPVVGIVRGIDDAVGQPGVKRPRVVNTRQPTGKSRRVTHRKVEPHKLAAAFGQKGKDLRHRLMPGAVVGLGFARAVAGSDPDRILAVAPGAWRAATGPVDNDHAVKPQGRSRAG